MSAPENTENQATTDAASSNAAPDTTQADAGASSESIAQASDPGTSEATAAEPSGQADSEADTGGDASTPSGDASASSESNGEAKADAATSADAPKKKRRRRRRKKSGGDATQQADGAEAEAAEGGDAPAAEAADGGDQKKKKKKKRSRKKPEARITTGFSVGDVVFGKIESITDDAIFIDLAGKGRAIFDKLELLLPEDAADEVERKAREAEAEAERIMGRAQPASGEGEAAENEGAPAAAEAGASEDGAQAAVAETPPADEQAASAVAETPPADEQAASAVAEEEPAAEAVQAAAQSEANDASIDAGAAAVGGETTEAASDAGAPTDEASEASAGLGTKVEADGPKRKVVRFVSPDDKAEAQSAGGDEAARSEAERDGMIQLPSVVLEPGATFVGVVHGDGGRGGLVVLTHHPHRGSTAKPMAARAFQDKTEISALVTGAIKGGVEVDVGGLRAFVPASHMDLRLGADLSSYVGQRLDFEVTQYKKRGRDVVLSRKSRLEVEAKALREEALKRLKVGEDTEGKVRTVVTFGAFIDLGGVEGLVPLAEMSHNRSDSPADVFKVGDSVTVRVTKIDEKGKIWLSRKATIPDPWDQAAEKYAVGSKHAGKVVRLQPFGAFIELESGIDGLIHLADLSPKRIEHPSDVVNVGDAIDVVVASCDVAHRKIGLHPAPMGDAAGEEPVRVAPHKVVKVVVQSIETGGLSVRIKGATGRYARGFITSAATGTPRGTELRKLFPVGAEFEAKVVDVDFRRGEVKLSIKALNQDNERAAFQQYRAKVKREAKFGTFGDLFAKKIQGEN